MTEQQTRPPRNEAAERLIALAANRQMPDNAQVTTLTVGELRAALREQTRITVERIRERLAEEYRRDNNREAVLDAILDEVGR